MLRSALLAALCSTFDALVFNLSLSAEKADQLLHVKKLVDGSACLGGWNAINPSVAPLLWTEDVAVAFRGLCLQKPGKHAAWYSKTVIGKLPASALRQGNRQNLPWKSLELAPDLRFHPSIGKNLKQCGMPDTDIAEGAEDPRLVTTKDGLYMIVTGYKVQSYAGSGRPPCGKHAVMLHASKVLTISPPKFGPPKELMFEGMGLIEKNWAMFTHGSSSVSRSTVHAVYSVYPHKIASVDLGTGKVWFVANTHSGLIQNLAKIMNTAPENFHGGAGVAHVMHGGAEYYLSVAHLIVHVNGRKQYLNFPYRFRAESPFDITHVGKKLNLVMSENPAYGEVIAFVTTCEYDQGDILIGYGSGDTSSRTLRVSIDAFNSQYFPSTFAAAEGRSEPEDSHHMHNQTRHCDSAIASQCGDEMTPSICRFCNSY